jgi:hypothetical protein
VEAARFLNQVRVGLMFWDGFSLKLMTIVSV